MPWQTQLSLKKKDWWLQVGQNNGPSLDPLVGHNVATSAGHLTHQCYSRFPLGCRKDDFDLNLLDL